MVYGDTNDDNDDSESMFEGPAEPSALTVAVFIAFHRAVALSSVRPPPSRERDTCVEGWCMESGG